MIKKRGGFVIPMKNNIPVSFKADEELIKKLDDIASFYDVDRSKLIKSILMGFILSWIDQRENGYKANVE